MIREAQCYYTWDWNDEIHANVDDLNGRVSCDAAIFVTYRMKVAGIYGE